MRKLFSNPAYMALGLGLSLGTPSLLLAQKTKPKKAAAPVEAEAEPKAPNLLPDWKPDSFDLKLGLVGGFRYRETEIAGVAVQTASTEIGLGARVPGIPLFPGNPGATIEPYGTYTWGSRNMKVKAEEIDSTESSVFQRFWYGGVFKLYIKPFRYALDLGKGSIRHDKEEFVDLEAQRLANDFGLMLLPFFSVHYTLTNYELKEEDESQASIEEVDHWVHARMSFPLFNFMVDLGPGHSQATYRAHLVEAGPLTKLGTAKTEYLKALASMNVFWKLGASASAKYILDANEVAGAIETIDQLPDEALNQRRSLASLPKDSLEASTFIGFQDLFAGFGLGWQYYYLELKQSGGGKQISRDHGFGLNFQSSI